MAAYYEHETLLVTVNVAIDTTGAEVRAYLAGSRRRIYRGAAADGAAAGEDIALTLDLGAAEPLADGAWGAAAPVPTGAYTLEVVADREGAGEGPTPLGTPQDLTVLDLRSV